MFIHTRFFLTCCSTCHSICDHWGMLFAILASKIKAVITSRSKHPARPPCFDRVGGSLAPPTCLCMTGSSWTGSVIVPAFDLLPSLGHGLWKASVWAVRFDDPFSFTDHLFDLVCLAQLLRLSLNFAQRFHFSSIQIYCSPHATSSLLKKGVRCIRELLWHVYLDPSISCLFF